MRSLRRATLHHAPGRLASTAIFVLVLSLGACASGGSRVSAAISAPPSTRTATRAATETGTRVPWQGNDWFLLGANVPWRKWGCDFGCGANGGVSDPTATVELDAVFSQARANGMHVLRWWVFEGEAWQISRDAAGFPLEIIPAVYADFDAALRLAEKYDLYYEFTLFSAPTHLPSAWLTDAAQREQLATALGQLFAHYGSQPRILSWDIFNEPEWDIWNKKIEQAPVQATVRAIADAVHTNSRSYVTVGAAMLDGLPFWVGQSLDYYEAHWYDPMSSGNWCARCTDYATVKARYKLDAPLIIGEFYAGPDTDAEQRFVDFSTKGYAGALAWSLIPDSTSDRMKIDLAAAGAYAGRVRDVGPSDGTTAPAVAASRPASVQPSFNARAEATPTAAVPGGTVTVKAMVTSTTSMRLLVDIEIYDPNGNKIFQRFYDEESFVEGQTKSFSVDWTIATTAQAGTYRIKIGLFSPGWGTMYAWNDSAAGLTIGSP